MSFDELFVLSEEKEDACFFGLERKWNYLQFGKIEFSIQRFKNGHLSDFIITFAMAFGISTY